MGVRARWLDELCLLLPALIGLVSSETGFNHHLLYVLPALPFLFAHAGRFAAVSIRPSVAKVICAVCLLLN